MTKDVNKIKTLASIKFKDIEYIIKATIHAQERMVDRDVEELVIVGNILALGEYRLKLLYGSNSEAIIIDNDKNLSIVISFHGKSIHIVTVIDKSNIFIKKNTCIVNL